MEYTIDPHSTLSDQHGKRPLLMVDRDPAFIVAVDPGGAFDGVGEFAGDSGGSWYYDAYGEALGLHQNHASDNTLDAVFMPVSRFSASSLAVLTVP